MKKIIMGVLDDCKDSQINLASKAARETIANLIAISLESKGCYTEYDDDEIEVKDAKESWVCSICGKSSWETEWDYIGSGTNHLGCELKAEEHGI
jgi:ferredoxin-like protein FixX